MGRAGRARHKPPNPGVLTRDERHVASGLHKEVEAGRCKFSDLSEWQKQLVRCFRAEQVLRNAEGTNAWADTVHEEESKRLAALRKNKAGQSAEP